MKGIHDRLIVRYFYDFVQETHKQLDKNINAADEVYIFSTAYLCRSTALS
jgi:hypothetical protein